MSGAEVSGVVSGTRNPEGKTRSGEHEVEKGNEKKRHTCEKSCVCESIQLSTSPSPCPARPDLQPKPKLIQNEVVQDVRRLFGSVVGSE